MRHVAEKADYSGRAAETRMGARLRNVSRRMAGRRTAEGALQPAQIDAGAGRIEEWERAETRSEAAD